MAAKTEKQSVWSPQHDVALAALTSLKVPHKEAKELIAQQDPHPDAGEILRLALRQRANANKRFTLPGGPENAAPLNRPEAMPAQSAVAPSALPMPLARRPMISPSPLLTSPGRDVYRDLARQIHGVNLRGFVPQRMAPIGPSQPLQQQQGQQSQPVVEKPRVRVRTTGSRIPLAPIGGESIQPEPASTAPARPPMIASDEEFHRLEPGTEFIWAPDHHIYRKEPEQEGSQPQKGG